MGQSQGIALSPLMVGAILLDEFIFLIIEVLLQNALNANRSHWGI